MSPRRDVRLDPADMTALDDALSPARISGARYNEQQDGQYRPVGGGLGSVVLQSTGRRRRRTLWVARPTDEKDLRRAEHHDPHSFIRGRLRIAAVPMVPEIRLYAAHPASGLWRLGGLPGQGAGQPPYWGYQWAGGLALARYILDRPEAVAGLSVLDLGAGSGLVGIAAALSGASKVMRPRPTATGWRPSN